MDGDADLPTWLSLKQDGAKLSGTGGSSPSTPYPILDGLMSDDCVRFGLNVGQRTFLYDLKFEGQELLGTVSVTAGNRTRTAAVRFERIR